MTELVVGSDGVIYVNGDGWNPKWIAGRAEFVGYALKRAEVERLGARGVFAWAAIGRLAFGSDGRVYVHAEDLPDSRGRKVFRGVAVDEAMAARMIEELHVTATNVVIQAGSTTA